MIRVNEHSQRWLSTRTTGAACFCAMYSDHSSKAHLNAINPVIVKREDGS